MRNYNHTVTQSIHTEASTKCGYWKVRKILWIILILILFRKFHLSHEKFKTCLQKLFTMHFTLQMVGNVTSLQFWVTNYLILTDKKCYSENDFISMLEFLIDNIFVEFGVYIFQQVIGIPMWKTSAPFLADLFLYSYEVGFIQKLIKDKTITEPKAFNLTFILTLFRQFSDWIPLI